MHRAHRSEKTREKRERKIPIFMGMTNVVVRFIEPVKEN